MHKDHAFAIESELKMLAKKTLLLIIAGICLLGISCGDIYETAAMQTVSNEDGETLTIVATPDNLNIASGGSITIQVMLSEFEGDPIEGVNVYMTTTLGALSENVLTSAADGTAIAVLNAADIEGWAVVVATYGTIQAMVRISMYFDGNNGAAGGEGGFEDDSTGEDTGSGGEGTE
jgi:hypothetical protein